MKLTERIHLVGSGMLGMNQTDDYDCNVYLLNAGDAYVLFDGGAGRRPEAVLEQVRADGLDERKIAYIVATHAHADHSGGLRRLRERTGAVVLGSPETARILTDNDAQAIRLPDAKAAGVYPADYDWAGCPDVSAIFDGARLKVGPFTLEWIAAPGHSSDMTCCYVRELRALFSGDAVFAGGQIAALSTPDFSWTDLAASIARLAECEIEGLFPGHLHPVLRHGGRSVAAARDSFAAGEAPRSIV